MAPTFYDDRVRDLLAVLVNAEHHVSLWSGRIPGKWSSPEECFEMMLGDSNLGEVLDVGDAYGEPTDGLLRRIGELARTLDFHRPLDDVLSDPRFIEASALCAAALKTLDGRPLGTVVGEPLGPVRNFQDK